MNDPQPSEIHTRWLDGPCACSSCRFGRDQLPSERVEMVARVAAAMGVAVSPNVGTRPVAGPMTQQQFAARYHRVKAARRAQSMRVWR